jgi:hypothetical protein
MTDQHAARDSRPTTQQIASAGATNIDVPEAPSQEPVHAAPDPVGKAAEPQAQLLEGDELQVVVLRWKEIQAQFVDEPRSAVQDADALVADLMQRLARTFAAERAQLESRWASGEDVSTKTFGRVCGDTARSSSGCWPPDVGLRLDGLVLVA